MKLDILQSAYDTAVTQHGRRSIHAAIALRALKEAKNRALKKEIRELRREKRRQAA